MKEASGGLALAPQGGRGSNDEETVNSRLVLPTNAIGGEEMHMIFEGVTAGLLILALAGCTKSQELAGSEEAYFVDKPDCGAAWSPTAAYGGGDNISRDGRNYTAAFATQGQDPLTSSAPAGSGKPWISGQSCKTPSAPIQLSASGNTINN